MRRSRFFIPTMKENPTEAVATSHKLMLRAGLIKMLSAGIYSYLPMGWRSAQKAMDIVRAEMNTIGAQEVFLPTLNPADIWDETGRNHDFGDEMFRLLDRKKQQFCLAPTHEEIICAVARGNIRSWRDMPQIWYQIQLKFRDEPRPRGGVLRMRHFLMKDSYSLDRDEEGLDVSYELHREAYQRIFEQCGLDYFIVGASSGLMGGAQSQEFMVESDAGEDQIARCDKCGYASNIEVATSEVSSVDSYDEDTLHDVHTPGKRTVDEVAAFLKIPPGRLIKTLIYMSPEGLIMVLISGEDELSESKLMRVVGGQVRPAHPDEIRGRLGADVGFLGPHGDHALPIYADLRLEDCKGMASGANRNDYHVLGLACKRDFNPDDFVDLRVIKEHEGCPVCGHSLRLVRGVELGHIFKLGTKYSAAMGATFLDEEGQEKPIIMGSYGIGIERIIAASIESNSDENGIKWNSALTPFEAVIIPLNTSDEAVVNQAENIYQYLLDEGYEVILDDRDARAGVKMKDADLTGIPVQIIISPRTVANNEVEVKNRWTDERVLVSPDDVSDSIEQILDSCWPSPLYEETEDSQ